MHFFDNEHETLSPPSKQAHFAADLGLEWGGDLVCYPWVDRVALPIDTHAESEFSAGANVRSLAVHRARSDAFYSQGPGITQKRVMASIAVSLGEDVAHLQPDIVLARTRYALYIDSDVNVVVAAGLERWLGIVIPERQRHFVTVQDAIDTVKSLVTRQTTLA